MYAHSDPNRDSKWAHNLLKKWSYFDKKNVLLKINFQEKGHLGANVLIYILAIYRRCILFQLFSRGIRMHIPILIGVQKGHISD